MRKIIKAISCLFAAFCLVFAASCSKEVDLETFRNKAYELKPVSSMDRGSVTVTGEYNVGPIEFYSSGPGGEWAFRGAIDEEADLYISNYLDKRAWAINVSGWWSINTENYGGTWIYKTGKVYEMTNGEVTFKFDGKNGYIIEYSDAKNTVSITWN